MLYNTQFNGSVRKIIQELEAKCFIITNKLALENNELNNQIYINAMNNTVKDVITKKLPDRLYMQLARFDITTVSKLKQIVQQEGRYDDIWSDRPKFQNTQNTQNKNYFSPKYNNASKNQNRSQNYHQASTSQNKIQYNNRNNNNYDQS